MVRSLYSGVSGLRSHQTRMDTIGNNIANVNTSGFKSSRVTFRDVYYQTTKSPTGGTDFSGGVNPSQVGYGTQVASIDTNMSRSSFQMTESGLDFAIAGDGFFQIQDAAGNIMYTRAGNLNLDPKGNLVDSKGNFVLGTPIFTDAGGNITGQGSPPSSNRLTLKIPDSIDKSSASIKELLGTEVKLNLSKIGPDGNMTVSFQQVQGQSPYAVLSGTSVAVYLDLNKQFTTLDELQAEIDKAINNSNIPETHPIRAEGGLKITATTPAGGETAVSSAGSIQAIIKPVAAVAAKDAKGSTKVGGTDIVATANTTAGFETAANGVQIRLERGPAPIAPATNGVWTGNVLTITLDETDTTVSSADIDGFIAGASGTPPANFTGATVAFTPVADIDATVVANFPKTITFSGGALEVVARPGGQNTIAMNATAPGSASNSYKTIFTQGTALDTAASWNGNTLMVALGTGANQATKAVIDAAIAAAAGNGTDAAAKTLTIAADIAADTTTVDGKEQIAAAIEYSKNGIYMNGGKNTFFTDVAKLLGVAKLEGGSYAGPQTIGDITNLAVGKDGIIVATHPVFGELVLGRIDLAIFDNPNGLEQLGDSYFGSTVNSGDAKIMTPDSQAAGALVSNALESSNVDLSKEFSDMIVTQRGFQANSRIITVSDEMLQELVNLKR